jgi:Flp pilus assembly protein TadG
MNKFFIRKKSEGQSIVEFALVLPVLLLLIFAIVEFGIIFNAYVTVVSSAREGARYGLIGNRNADEIKERVKQTAGMLDTSEEKFSVDIDKDSNEIKVLVTYRVDILDPIMGGILGDSIPIKAQAVMAME